MIGDYQLRLTLADGIVGDVDFARREWQGVFELLRDPAYFARVEVHPEAGTIAWPDGLDMALNRFTGKPDATASTPREQPADRKPRAERLHRARNRTSVICQFAVTKPPMRMDVGFESWRFPLSRGGSPWFVPSCGVNPSAGWLYQMFAA